VPASGGDNHPAPAGNREAAKGSAPRLIIFIHVPDGRDKGKTRAATGPSMEPARIKPFRLFRGNGPSLAGHLRRIDGK